MKDVDQDTLILLGARASRVENQDAIDACIVGMLGDPKEVGYTPNTSSILLLGSHRWTGGCRISSLILLLCQNSFHETEHHGFCKKFLDLLIGLSLLIIFSNLMRFQFF